MLTNSGRSIENDKKVESDLRNQDLSNHLFVRLVAKKRRFENIDFKYTIFETCYLRNCVFDSCNFTGCRFINSNFHGTTFLGCIFDYSYFEKTSVDSELLRTGCPGLENLKMRFARTLRVNYQQMGDAQSVNLAIAIELQAKEIHLRKAWKSNESYYRRKYSGWQRVRVFAEWINFKTLDFLWGNGESPIKLLRTALATVLVIAVLDGSILNSGGTETSSMQHLANALEIFMGTLAPEHYPRSYLVAVLAARLSLFAFLMAILIKKFGRR